MDEQAILSACQAGRLDDFALLYDAYVHPIYRFVHYRTRDRDLAEDIVSQTFLRALEKIKSFDPARGPFGAWLYRIARNLIVDHYRAHHAHAPLSDDWDAAEEQDVPDRAGPLPKELTDALAGLGEQQREILLLRLWNDLSYRDIARITGKSEGNCKVIFSRAIATLRKTVRPDILALLFLFPLLR